MGNNEIIRCCLVEITYRVLPALIKYQLQIILIIMALPGLGKIALVINHQHNYTFGGAVEAGLWSHCWHFHTVLCSH